MFLLCSKMWYSSKNKQNSYKEFFLIIILIGWVNPITSDDQLWNLSQLPTPSVSALPPASCRFQGCHGYMSYTCSACRMWLHQPHRPLSHVHLFATIRLSFIFPIIQFVFPTKFCTGNGFNFSWDQLSLGELEAKLIWRVASSLRALILAKKKLYTKVG